MNRTTTTIVLVLVAISVILPFVPLFVWSMSGRWFYPALWPQQWGLRAWNYLFHTAIVLNIVQH